MTSIEISGLSFAYNPDTPVLSGIDLRLEGPGLVCIIGPNGVGKSTLVKCINRIINPTGGEIVVNGRNVKDYGRKELAETVGFVPAASVDVFAMPVIDTILIGRHNKHKWKTTAEDLEIVHRVMRLFDLEEFAMRGFNQLSAGQHQKVALARGLVQETPILILDEPTSNLDVRHQVYIAEILRGIAIRENKLIIMISHDLNIAARYAHKIVMMTKPGCIRCVGTPSEVITEEAVSSVYGVECTVVEHKGSPHVILGSAL